ncbi:MAG TPA: beta-agarase, partial [Pseudomonas sp.]|nr:beta-agarase [Pseudomonas sp.]
MLLSVLLGYGDALMAGDRQLFNFVKPIDAVQVSTDDAFLPSLIAEPVGNEVLRRITFNPAERPSLRLAPAAGNWDWTQHQAIDLRVQNAMDWALTLEVRIESADGASLHSRIALPAGPAQTLLVPL